MTRSDDYCYGGKETQLYARRMSTGGVARRAASRFAKAHWNWRRVSNTSRRQKGMLPMKIMILKCGHLRAVAACAGERGVLRESDGDGGGGLMAANMVKYTARG